MSIDKITFSKYATKMSDAESFLCDLEGVGDDESDVAGVDVLRDEDEDGRGERHEVPDRLQPHSQPPAGKRHWDITQITQIGCVISHCNFTHCNFTVIHIRKLI